MNYLLLSGDFIGLALGIAFTVLLIVLGVLLIPVIFFQLTLQNTLKAVAPKNRQMPPGQVWLSLIPLFGIVWNFIVLNRLSDSIQAELRMRGENTAERPAYNVGLAYCILGACMSVPCINYLALLPFLILWIIYWIKVAEYKSRLEQVPAAPSGSEIFPGY